MEARALGVVDDERLRRGGGGLQWVWERTFGRRRMRAMGWRSDATAGTSERGVAEVMIGAD